MWQGKHKNEIEDDINRELVQVLFLFLIVPLKLLVSRKLRKFARLKLESRIRCCSLTFSIASFDRSRKDWKQFSKFIRLKNENCSGNYSNKKIEKEIIGRTGNL